MKRVKAACICQTLHFQLKEGLDHETAVKAVGEEYKHYKYQLEQRHKIIAEETLLDGSIVVKLIKQYNRVDPGDYLG
ncbi:MAG: hypothetical protein SOX72_04700 [Oscillospiraceae bacterium]|nr:hypothetical protein [Oscillospiraceae bacterium]